jgi:hypothetical protein
VVAILYIKLSTDCDFKPVDIPDKEKIESFSFVRHKILFKTENGKIYFFDLGHKKKWCEFYHWRDLKSIQMPEVASFSNGDSCLFITKDNQVYGNGDNVLWQLGLGDKAWFGEPTLLTNFNNEKIIQTCSGERHSIFLTRKGDIFTCGSCCIDNYGQLGHGKNENKIKIPKKITSLKNVEFICPGQRQSFFITKRNKVYMCGKNKGNDVVIIKSAEDCIYTPTEIEFFRGKGIVQINKGDFNVYFISKHGDIYVSGCPIGDEPEDVKGIRSLKGVKCLPERLPKIKNPEILLGKKEKFEYLVEVEEPVELGWFFNDNQSDSKKPDENTQKPKEKFTQKF